MSTVAIIDFGSQVTQLIARRIRELGVYSEVFPSNADVSHILKNKIVSAFILSGGPSSIKDLDDIPGIVQDVMSINANSGIPVLGICYGFQAINHYFGRAVESNKAREFGGVKLEVVGESAITQNVWNVGDIVDVWMSHSDSVVGEGPSGFVVNARSTDTGAVALISDDLRKIYGMQFHPEVSHTPSGCKMLNNFLTVAGCSRDWTVATFLNSQIDDIRNTVDSGKVVAAISGGVDSSVAALLVHRAIGDGLKCVFVDTGCLRSGDLEVVKGFFIDQCKIPVSVVDAADLFVRNLKGVDDPEEKRKIIGKTFIDVFEREAKRIGDAEFLMQGTIYPDVIESGAGGAGVTIKSHHNVGGLPDVLKLKLVEPIRRLFKDEVRLLGKELGIPDSILRRHPFPGPGLAVRIIGEVTHRKLELLREVDRIYIEMMGDSGLYDKIWQAFAVLTSARAVGVMGDGRTYGHVCALRAVTSCDGMTAECYPFGEDDEAKLRFLEFLQRVGGAIVRNVPDISRVVYDITSKPPATIEWE